MKEDIDVANRQVVPEYKVNESADKIVLKTSVKRGSETRDQDKLDVKVKGDNPEETAEKLAETLDALEEYGVAETLRETQPGGRR